MTTNVFSRRGGAAAAERPFLQKAPDVTTKAAQKVLKGASVGPGYGYLGGDFMALPREVMSFSNAMNGRPDGIGVHLFGMTAVFSLFTGYMAGKRGHHQYETASKINDVVGQGLGAVNMARAPAEMLGGLTFTAFRGASIAGTFTSSTALTTAQTVLSGLGSAFFVLTYAFIAVPSAVTLYKNINFGRKLSAAIDGAEGELAKAKAALTVLMEEASGTEAEKSEFLAKVMEEINVDADCMEIDEGALTDEELKFLESKASELAPEGKKSEVFSHFKEHFVRFKAEKFAEFTRKVGAETAAKVRDELAKPSAKRLDTRLKNIEDTDALKEANEVIEGAQSEILKNRILHVAIVAFCVLGITALILGNIFTGGLLGTIIVATWILVSLGMLAIDGYFLYQALKNGEMENSDKIAIFVMNALMITMAGATIFLSGGVALIVAAAVLGTAFAGTSLYLALSSGDDDAEDLAEEAAYEDNRLAVYPDLDPTYQIV